MVYLDYSATTPVNEEVLDTFVEVNRKYIGNPNSSHKLGIMSKKVIDDATLEIANLLKIKPEEIIYTSGASESNNLAIKGIALRKEKGRIISTMLEHSSITSPLNYLGEQGFDIDLVNIKDDGQIDLDHLKTLIKEDTILVSICAVDSELGIRQPVEEIGNILREYPDIVFHVDATQCIGKDNIDLSNIDLVSFSAHKIYGLKGIGGLIRKEPVMLQPLIHGGKSTTKFRSGTPAVGLIVSLAKAMTLIFANLDDKIRVIREKNQKLRNFLSKYKTVLINSTEHSIPSTVNFSILDVDSISFVQKLSDNEVYISNKSACASNTTMSVAVKTVTKDEDRALTSVRVSLSYLTTEEELNYFYEVFDKVYKEMTGDKE